MLMSKLVAANHSTLLKNVTERRHSHTVTSYILLYVKKNGDNNIELLFM